MSATPVSPANLTIDNPYSAPGADLTLAALAGETYQPRFFSRHGRIGRVRYFAYLTGAWLLVATVMMAIGVGGATLGGLGSAYSTLMPLLMLVSCMVGFAFFVIRRLNDVSQSGWLALLALVPFVNIAFNLWLLCAPGAKHTNQYGPAAAKNGSGVMVACVCGVIMLTATMSFVVLTTPLIH